MVSFGKRQQCIYVVMVAQNVKPKNKEINTEKQLRNLSIELKKFMVANMTIRK
jgi:hypothetical protein